MEGCVLCETEGGALVWRGERFRLVRVNEPYVPAFWRWIANEHIVEVSDLNDDAADECWRGLRLVERTIRDTLTELGHPPTKMNVASLGNLVAHLHFHVIARYATDAHFPAPIWATPKRAGEAGALKWEQDLRLKLDLVDVALKQALREFDGCGR